MPHREDSEQRVERLMTTFDLQIQDIEACSNNTPYWDGYCGLVKVCDEDLVRRDADLQDAHQPALLAAAQQQQQGAGQQRRGATSAATSGSASARTPPSGSHHGSAGSSSPFKVGPRAAPHNQQPAAVLAEQAAAALQQGRLHDAESLLHKALERCATTDTQLATHAIDLMLSCEREWQQTPTHSRSASEAEQEEVGDAAASSGGSGEATGLLRQAVQALAGGEERRAVQLLQRAQAACPGELSELRRRIALYLELVLCKRRT